MDSIWIYAGAGFVGLLWGMGSIAETIGNMVSRRRQTVT